MTLTIDADVVWKPRNILNTVAPNVNQELELEQVRVVLMRVLSRSPEACTALLGALEELGTTYVKLGQLLSSRPDLMPDVYIEELSQLVDAVPPVPFTEIEAVIRADLGDDVFASIDPEPLAAASVAQTHPAVLTTGPDFVVKRRRCGSDRSVRLEPRLLTLSRYVHADRLSVGR